MSSTRRSGWGIVFGLVGAACTLVNPAYEGTDGGEPTEGTASTEGDSATTRGTTEGVGTADGTGTDTGIASGCASDDDCADGVFCNGVETCDPKSPDADDEGCVAGPGNPCAQGASCEDPGDCVTDCRVTNDADEDGEPAVECGGLDCDDSNDQIHPSARELCNQIDEDCDPTTVGGEDLDGDGQVSFECCNRTVEGVKCGADCDDDVHGIVEPGGDWAHCGGCGSACDVLQACMLGACVPARRVFVTSEGYLGDMDGQLGLEAADDLCQAHADLMGLGGAWLAFLVDGDTGLERLEAAAVPYVRLDGIPIANDWLDLTDGTLMQPLYLDEQREPHFGPAERAWTGLAPNGFPSDVNCVSWTVGESEVGANGNVPAIDGTWRGNGMPRSCGEPARLYCIEQDESG